MFRRSVNLVAARLLRPALKPAAKTVRPISTVAAAPVAKRSRSSFASELIRPAAVPILRGLAPRLSSRLARPFTTCTPFMSDAKKDATATAVPAKPSTAAVMTPAARDLAQHLNDEYKQEEVPDAPAVPDGWTMKDFKNESFLYLKREMGDEKITIRVELMPPEDNVSNEKDDEEEWSDEGEDRPSENEQDDAENVDDEPAEADHHVFFEVIVSKPKVHSGAITFHVVGDERSGDFIINRVMFSDAISATENSPQAALKRDQVYQGPAVPDMPVDMVNLMSDYLAERGINEELIKFLYDYCYYKEQREYVSWLKMLTVFLTAK